MLSQFILNIFMCIYNKKKYIYLIKIMIINARNNKKNEENVLFNSSYFIKLVKLFQMGRIQDPFFLSPYVCMAFGDISNYPDLVGGLLILNNSIHLCQTDSSPAQQTPLNKIVYVIMKGVFIFQPRNISIVSSEVKVNQTFQDMEHHFVPSSLMVDFLSNPFRFLNFTFICIHKCIGSRFVNFVSSSGSIDPCHPRKIQYPSSL